MKYDEKLWEGYTSDNENKIQDKLSDFIYYSTAVLGAKKICEVGCNVGNNLTKFPENSDITGVDMSAFALEKAKKRFPTFKFDKGSALELPYSDSSFDLVFTRGVLIHIHPNDIEVAVKEIFRISKKWILNLEYFGKDNEKINWKRNSDLLWYRDMKKHWEKYPVEIINDIQVPLDIDSDKTRCTLVRKS